MTAAAAMREVLRLVDRYWDLAHAEGKEGRDHDTEAGDAQATRQAIETALARMAEEAEALRYELADLHDSLRTLFIGCPGLPILAEHPEDFDAATNTLHGLCLVIGIHGVSVPP